MRCAGGTVPAVLPAWSSPDQAQATTMHTFLAGEVGMKKNLTGPGRLAGAGGRPVGLGLCSCISVLDGKVENRDINNVEKMIGGTENFV